MTDVTIPDQDELDIRRTVKLMKLRAKELTLENRLAIERRLVNTPEAIRAEAENRLRAPVTPRPEVGKLAPEKTSDEVKNFVKGRSTLYEKGVDIGTGAKDDQILRKDVADQGVMDGLLKFFGGIDDKGVYTSEGVMKAVRLSSALGKSDQAKEFLKIARDNIADVKRLMANRPDDLKNLLEAGEFGAMKTLIEQEIRSPKGRYASAKVKQDAHQFREHGAHNPLVQMVLMSIEAKGAPKSAWISADAERKAVEWAEKKVRDEIAALSGGDTAAADSIHFKGKDADMTKAAQIVSANAAATTPDQKWVLKGDGLVPSSWADLVANSTKFDKQVEFEGKKLINKGTTTELKPDKKVVGPLFRQEPVDALIGSNADIGVTSSLARRKITATATDLGGPPADPKAHPLLDAPDTTLAAGGVYYFNDNGTWKEITVSEYEDSPNITEFKAVFRKTSDAPLTYTVYTAYPTD